MDGVVSFLLLFYIFINSLFDLREKKVPIALCYLLIPLGFVVNFVLQIQSIPDLILSFVPGIVMMIIAKLTREAIGYGDAWMVLCLGAYLPFFNVLMIVLGAVFFTGLCGLVLIICFRKNRKTTIPFVPFLFIAFLLERIIL